MTNDFKNKKAVGTTLPLLFVIAAALVFSGVATVIPTSNSGISAFATQGNGDAGTGEFIAVPDNNFENAFGVTPEEQQQQEQQQAGQQQQQEQQQQEQTQEEPEQPQVPAQEDNGQTGLTTNETGQPLVGPGGQEPTSTTTEIPTVPTTPDNPALNNGVDDLNCADFYQQGIKAFPPANPDEDKLDQNHNGVACEGQVIVIVQEPQTPIESGSDVNNDAGAIIVVDDNANQIAAGFVQAGIDSANAGDMNGVIVNGCEALKVLQNSCEVAVVSTEDNQTVTEDNPVLVIPIVEENQTGQQQQQPEATQPEQGQQGQQGQQCTCQIAGNGFMSLEQVLSPDLIGAEAFSMLQDLINLYNLHIVGDAIVVGDIQVKNTLEQETQQTTEVIQSQLPENVTQAIENATEGTGITTEDVVSNATEAAIVEQVANDTGISDAVSESTTETVTDVVNNETTVQEAVQQNQQDVTEAAVNTDVTPTDVQNASNTVQQNPATVYELINQSLTALQNAKVLLFGQNS